ncbi:creatininase family protein, partial [Ectothiorhodospiraceae bacterium WFHF3C12]|nr:creatininase family protein [Ectothiorhodospiraceae bacterium WFHF3C12]
GLPDGFPLVTLPPLAVGASQEHANFCGTLTLPHETVITLLEAYGAALARAGVLRLVLVNAHGGNSAVMDIAALRLRHRHGMIVVKYHYQRSPLPEAATVLPETELRHGYHGGALETAMMRHLYPDRIRADRLDHHPSSGADRAAAGNRVGPEAEGNLAWLAEDLNPAGVVGDARRGTAELGERLVHHYAGRLSRLLQETRTMPLPGQGSTSASP